MLFQLSNLLIPLACAGISEGIFRSAAARDGDKEAFFTNGLDVFNKAYEDGIITFTSNYIVRWVFTVSELTPAIRSQLFARALPIAEEKGITLVVETTGLFCRTALLRDLLDGFACDSLGALWDMSASFFESGETAEKIIQNLGAYVRHVHAAQRGED